MLFLIYNKGPNTQTGKGFEIKIMKDKGTSGVKAEDSPFAVTFFLFFSRFLKSFGFSTTNCRKRGWHECNARGCFLLV